MKPAKNFNLCAYMAQSQTQYLYSRRRTLHSEVDVVDGGTLTAGVPFKPSPFQNTQKWVTGRQAVLVLRSPRLGFSVKPLLSGKPAPSVERYPTFRQALQFQ
jgi:hypothetical protein